MNGILCAESLSEYKSKDEAHTIASEEHNVKA